MRSVPPRPLLLVLLAAAACARILDPPGGPADRVAPRLLSTRPDSLVALRDFSGDVEFEFDEVVSEGSAPNFGLGTGDLERLVILSPSARIPVIRWKRNRIAVHPREGWRPNTVYRVELLPGLADLRNNRSRNGGVVTFTTGAPLPTATLRGTVVDWTTRRPAARALVEALHLADSLAYRTTADSAGRFLLTPLPAGEYLVYGTLDQNADGRRQARESYDTVRVAAGRDSVGEVWAFRHDTTAARIASVAPADSMGLILTFTQPVSPFQRLPADSVELIALPDSARKGVVDIVTKELYDSLYAPKKLPDTTAAGRARADSARATALADSLKADSTRRAREAAALRIAGTARRAPARRDTTGTGQLLTRPALFDKLWVRAVDPLPPGSRYMVVLHGLRNLSGVTGTARSGVIRIPERPKADTTAKAVTRKVPGDSVKAKPDTTRKPRA